jgi:hypothetical protein
LRRVLHGRALRIDLFDRSTLTHQLIDGWHE